MPETINCDSCGAPNQLPEGRNTMFCAFCGKGIEKKMEKSDSSKLESTIITKPQISYDYNLNQVSLKLVNRGIKSINEITIWFSDNELESITNLDLSNNEITSLNGIERFKFATNINLSNNKISNIDTPDIYWTLSYTVTLNLSGNLIKNFNNKDIEHFNSMVLVYRDAVRFYSTKINLSNNPFENFDWLDKINFEKIFNTYPLYPKKDSYGKIEPMTQGDYDYKSITIITDFKIVERYHPKSKFGDNKNSTIPDTKETEKTENKNFGLLQYIICIAFTIGGFFMLFTNEPKNIFIGLMSIIFFGGGCIIQFCYYSSNN